MGFRFRVKVATPTMENQLGLKSKRGFTGTHKVQGPGGLKYVQGRQYDFYSTTSTWVLRTFWLISYDIYGSCLCGYIGMQKSQG